MKLEGKITMLINRDYTSIEIEDSNANTVLCRIRLNPEELNRILSREGCVPCELEVYDIFDRIGKKHENKTFEFELPEWFDRYNIDNNELINYCNSILSDGWISDGYFNSQNSFFNKDNKKYARVTTRRYI